MSTPESVAGAPPSEKAPVYRKVRHGGGLWLIECNEGWRSTVLCSGMYEAEADFLLSLLGRRPRRPQAGSPAGHERTEAERLRSAEITLATIQSHVARMLALSKDAGVESPLPQVRGYDRAMRAVRAILDARWLPEGTPAVLNPEEDL